MSLMSWKRKGLNRGTKERRESIVACLWTEAKRCGRFVFCVFLSLRNLEREKNWKGSLSHHFSSLQTMFFSVKNEAERGDFPGDVLKSFTRPFSSFCTNISFLNVLSTFFLLPARCGENYEYGGEKGASFLTATLHDKEGWGLSKETRYFSSTLCCIIFLQQWGVTNDLCEAKPSDVKVIENNMKVEWVIHPAMKVLVASHKNEDNYPKPS